MARPPSDAFFRIRGPGDIPFVPTPEEVLVPMLRLAGVGSEDVVYDLGCGDGRIVIAAAREFGARGVGVDLDAGCLEACWLAAREAGVLERVDFRRQSWEETDLRPATVVTLYLAPDVNRALRPRLLSELRPGSRIVSHGFTMGDWKPERWIEAGGKRVFLWTVPARE